MTKNQIAYAELLEKKRSNRAQEDLTAKRDAATKEVSLGNLFETQQHNRVTEKTNLLVLGENQRHNYAQEALNKRSIDESSRHNQATEVELNRSNVARERETNRANLANEQELRYYHDASLQLEADKANANIALGYAELSEQRRKNTLDNQVKQQTLAETKRANKAHERDVDEARANTVWEFNLKADETERHDRAMEQVQERNAASTETDTARKIGDTILNGIRLFLT